MIMELSGEKKRLRRAGFFLLAAMLALGAWPSRADSVSTFGVPRRPGQIPAAIDLDDIWFYGEDHSRQIPDIGLEWLAAAFDRDALERPSADSFGSDGRPGKRLIEKAREIVRRFDAIADVFYDPNLAEDGCFFHLREGLKKGDLKDLIRSVDLEEGVAYVHPTLIVGGKTVAYFNAFRMRWKTGVEEASRKRLLAQAHVFAERPGELYRVDVFAIPFFRAVNLLAQDIRIASLRPVLVPLEPSIRVGLSVPLEGCRIGDKIPFALRVDFSDRIRLDPGSFVNINLRPSGIQKELFDLRFDPYDYVKAASRSPLLLTGWLKIYSPGEFLIPAVEVRYECPPCSGDRNRSIKTRPIPLKVASLVPSKLEKAKLAVPVDNVNPDLAAAPLERQARKSFRRAIVFFLLAAGLLGWTARQWVAGRRERAGETARTREDELAERLREHLERPPAGPHWVYAGEAGRLLREYLDARFELGGNPAQGSGEVFTGRVRGRAPEEIASRLGPILRETDRVVSMEAAEYPDLDSWRRDILALVDLARTSGR